MSFILAVKSFFKAFKDPKAATLFLKEQLDPKFEKKEIEKKERDLSHLRLLTLLQQRGRLIDFLKEDLTTYSDAEIGLAVRKIQIDCQNLLEEVITIRPLSDEKEGAKIQIPLDYDAKSFKLMGKMQGNAPYQGTILHAGWKAHKQTLPKKLGDSQTEILSPVEVEIL